MTALIRFSRGTGVAGWAVRSYTWSRFAHVGFLLAPGIVLDAAPGSGVSVREQPALDGDALFRADVPDAVVDAAVTWARNQVGARYDYIGVLGLGLHRNWRDESHWWCSELVAAAFEHAGHPLLNAKFLSRISPQDLLLSPYLIPVARV